MAGEGRKVMVVATPTSLVLSHLLHVLSHKLSLGVTVLTCKTSVALSGATSHPHHNREPNPKHHHEVSKINHIQTDFSESELQAHLKNSDAVICCFTGSDIHLTNSIVDAASEAGTKLFIPSEYGLDTSNSKIRDLLPPYQTRFQIQEKLKQSGMNWIAIYSGIVLEDALKTDGVLGIDVLWASVVAFPHKKETKVALSTYREIAGSIVDIVSGRESLERNALYVCSFKMSLGEIVAVVETEIEKPLDRYEGDFEGAKREAAKRMKLGYFDGGVALLGRVAVWNDDVDAWNAWTDEVLEKKVSPEKEIKKVVRMVRNGEIGGDGCGC